MRSHDKPGKHRKSSDEMEIHSILQFPALGTIVGSSTGEAEGDTVPGGWEGTDDATSTSPPDLVAQQTSQSAYGLGLSLDELSPEELAIDGLDEWVKESWGDPNSAENALEEILDGTESSELERIA